ncbi:MAG: DUF4352 domain-containing protein [Sphingobacteriia bacterium]
MSKALSVAAIATFTFFAIASSDDKKSPSSSGGNSSEQSVATSVGIGQTLQTEYFSVTVNKVSINDRVNTGNEFADLKAEQGNKYLIINATFKNTDQESRMIVDGSVWINYNGKDYEFDKSETVMLEGWGTMLDQINPLTSKTTNLVYKIPAEITGTALWNPGRSDKDQVINLGVIK